MELHNNYIIRHQSFLQKYESTNYTFKQASKGQCIIVHISDHHKYVTNHSTLFDVTNLTITSIKRTSLQLSDHHKYVTNHCYFIRCNKSDHHKHQKNISTTSDHHKHNRGMVCSSVTFDLPAPNPSSDPLTFRSAAQSTIAVHQKEK